MDEINQDMREAVMEVIDNQLRDDDPPEARQTLDRLISEGISEENAKMYIGQAVCVEIWDTVTNRLEFDPERYRSNLEKLPDEPSEERLSSNPTDV